MNDVFDVMRGKPHASVTPSAALLLQRGKTQKRNVRTRREFSQLKIAPLQDFQRSWIWLKIDLKITWAQSTLNAETFMRAVFKELELPPRSLEGSGLAYFRVCEVGAQAYNVRISLPILPQQKIDLVSELQRIKNAIEKLGAEVQF